MKNFRIRGNVPIRCVWHGRLVGGAKDARPRIGTTVPGGTATTFSASALDFSYDSTIDTLSFLFTDIEASTELLRLVGDDLYAELLARHHGVIRDALARHGGREQNTQGDAFFASFTSARACVAAAIEIQTTLERDAASSAHPLRVRAGIHSGEANETSTGLVGFEVHRAARVAAVGFGGQTLLSSSSAALVAQSLPSGVTLRPLGLHRLKDLGAPEAIFQLVVPGLPENFPPLRSLDNPELPNNLPTTLTAFIGRAEEVAEIHSLIERSRLVTLTGAGGSGKTRLALQTAAEMLDGRGDGVWFIDLAAINDADLVAVGMIETLEVRREQYVSPLEDLVRALRDQSLLLIIDNCEHLIDEVATIIQSLLHHCADVRVVATSREPLGVEGEEVYRVRSMSLPPRDVETVADLAGSESVDLFVSRARSFDKTFTVTDDNATLVASMCRRLDGIPLAIELAAARLSSMSLNDLHDRLDQRFRLLTGGRRGALPRQQTLGAMVSWSYDLLTDAERVVLRRLSIFVNGFDLRAAEVVCVSEGINLYDVTDLLASLVAKSLVVAERMGASLRYRLLETIRQFAAEQVLQIGGEGEMTSLRQRHAEHYLAVCVAAEAPLHGGPSQVQLIWQLEGDWDNVRAAMVHFLLDEATFKDALTMVSAIRAFLIAHDHAEIVEAIVPALDASSEVPPRVVEVRVLDLAQRRPDPGRRDAGGRPGLRARRPRRRRDRHRARHLGIGASRLGRTRAERSSVVRDACGGDHE